MAKRNQPKGYLDKTVKEIVTAINNLHNRLTSVESVFSTYIAWMKHDKKFRKHLEKKFPPKKDESKQPEHK